jgi:hypothetical protein
VADPTGRFLIAFNDSIHEPAPTWTRIDSTPNLVVSYTIDRGRQYELDRTDVGRATVTISDTDGVLDPTNAAGPYWGLLEPLLQATIGRRNPVTGVWYTRYRGFIEEFDYVYDPSQQLNQLVLTLVDMFEVLSATQMIPDTTWGSTPPDKSVGMIFYDNATMQDRITAVLSDAGIPPEFSVVFSGNVKVYEGTYNPGESAMTAVQEAADAEFPGVSNVFTDRLGRLAVHGRLAKFDPAGTLASATPGSWDWHHWKAGDGAAVTASPSDTAHVRRFAFNRGLSKIINSAYATPLEVRHTGTELAAQHDSDTASIGKYGIRSWSAQNLLTQRGILDDADDLTETRRFATYYVQNYSTPRDRITTIQFRPINPAATGAAANWALLSQVDISDQVDVTVAGAGGGGFALEPYFVEGVHEQVQPLTPDYDDVTLTLDLSPKAYWTDNPFPVS